VEYIQRVFSIMRQAHWHQFQVLTKRAETLDELNLQLNWPKNVWMGVSIESDKYAYRANHLRNTGAAVKFLSLEPLLGPLPSLDLTGIHWVIVGGESGPGARTIKERWVVDLQSLCSRNDVPFFFKQWGGVNKKAAGRLLSGRTYDEMPNLPILFAPA
jgi:protein gp37